MATLVLLHLSGSALACSELGEVPRTILALYDGRHEVAPRFTRIHRYGEMVLNHMGYRLKYIDISNSYEEIHDQPVAATLSWFDTPVGDPIRLSSWLAALTGPCGESPARLVLGHTGLSDSAARAEQGSAYLARLGISYGGGEIPVGVSSVVESMNTALIGTETAFDVPPGARASFVATNASESQLRMQSGSSTVDLVVLAPRAVYADDSVLVRYDPRGGTLWSSDPFALFSHALPSGPWPIPDTTTLSGRRMYFATVDSNGWATRLPARQFGDQPPLAAEVLDTDLIAPFPDLPISVALSVGDLDLDLAGQAALRGREVASDLFQLPQVQAATTGASMIRDWNFFATYNPQSEEAVLASGPRRDTGEGIVISAVQNLSGAFSTPALSAFDITPFAPRKYANIAFDLQNETVGAISAISDIAPAGSPSPVFFWSGNAIPFLDAIAAVTATGSENIGGGGGLATAKRPSLSQLWPLGVETEVGVQVYDALSDDAAFTNFWTSDLYGFLALRQTLSRTENPRRLKPFHLSFAAHSATHFATRSAVKQHLGHARSAEVTPVTAARYARIVEGFYGFRAVAVEPAAWRIDNRGGLQTVRFENSLAQALDFDGSEGVLGARRKGATLYVALDSGVPAPLIVLGQSDDPSGMIRSGTAPALVHGRAEILAMVREDCISRATVLGYGQADFEWLAAPNRSYQVTLYEADGTTRQHWEQISSDQEGRLNMQLPLPPGQETRISIEDECTEE